MTQARHTSDQSFATPVLFLIFNRPETTEKVFRQIRATRPLRLFVSADGPRLEKQGEEERCNKARQIVQQIDWKCDLKTNFREKNLGCKVAVSSAITWFFEHVEEGIILEDDCVPDLSFFPYCESLLAHYRDDERIMHIGGVYFQDGRTRGDGSYYYSRLNQIWGWATWRRAWAKYDLTIVSYPEILRQGILSHVFHRQSMENFWKKRFALAFNNQIDTWDIQWQYAMSINNGLSVVPNSNLVTNIGFEDGATHTIDSFNGLANRRTTALNELRHPTLMIPDDAADYYVFRKYFSPPKPKKLYYLIRRTSSALRKRIFHA